MLINISDAQVVQPLLQRKSLSPEHLYLYSGKRFTPGSRVAGESLVALETELTQSTLLYLQAQDLFEELDCCHKVLSKALVDEEPETFVPVLNELAERFRHIAVHHFDLAYAYLRSGRPQEARLALGKAAEAVNAMMRYFRADLTPMPPAEFPSQRAIREQQTIQNVEIGIEKEDGATVTGML